ncbi:MAG: BMP family protein [Bacillota bacterium]
MLKKLIAFALALLMAASMAACVGEEAPASNADATQKPVPTSAPEADPTPGNEKKTYKIGFLMSGAINDSAWCAIAYAELQNMKAAGHDTAYTENVEAAAIEENLRNYANEGYELIIGHGFEFGDPVLLIADEYPDIYFFVTGKKPAADTVVPKNVCFVDSKYQEITYLIGMLAAGTSKTHCIGYIAGATNPTQIAGYNAFIEGAKYMDPNCDVKAVITGTFTDPAKGQETAIAQIEAGADIIVQSASNTGLGAMEAAVGRGVYVIGNGSGQEKLYPDHVIATYFINTQAILANCISMMENGQFGDQWRPGVKDNICQIPYINESLVPKETMDAFNKRKQEIIDGTFSVPENLVYNP